MTKIIAQTNALIGTKPLTKVIREILDTGCSVELLILLATSKGYTKQAVHSALRTIGVRSRSLRSDRGKTRSPASQSKDLVASAKRYLDAAEQGDARAQWNIGLMYLAGLGVPQDLAVAEQWIAKAAAQGYADALAVQVDALVSQSGGLA